MPNNLIIFDVDGTLTDTVCMDSDIFLGACIKQLGIEKLNKQWDEYKYSTDSGFTLEIFEKHIGRAPNKHEVNTIQQDFFDALSNKITQDPRCCEPIPGAKSIFKHISQITSWDTAIATGGWRKSALMKLNHAHIAYQESPIASGDDHIERREIINIAINRSKQHYTRKQYKQIIYVGDRAWDYQAARDLGIHFVGIGHEFHATQLNIPVIANYTDQHLIDLLNQTITTAIK